MRYYLATGQDNRGLFSDVRALLDNHGALELDWTVMIDNYMQNPSLALKKTIAASEIACVKSADVFVLILPGGHGSMVEFGTAYACGKDIFVYDPMHKMERYHFLRLPGLNIVDNLDDLEEQFSAKAKERK